MEVTTTDRPAGFTADTDTVAAGAVAMVTAIHLAVEITAVHADVNLLNHPPCVQSARLFCRLVSGDVL